MCLIRKWSLDGTKFWQSHILKEKSQTLKINNWKLYLNILIFKNSLTLEAEHCWAGSLSFCETWLGDARGSSLLQTVSWGLQFCKAKVIHDHLLINLYFFEQFYQIQLDLFMKIWSHHCGLTDQNKLNLRLIWSK